MRLSRCVLLCLSAVSLLGVGNPRGWAQANFKTVVVFGDSLSDTGNVAHLTQSATLGLIRYPSDIPLLGIDYTDGRFTDGKDTQPAAQGYFGVWVEQLAASFAAKPAVTDSLDGGTNFAYGDATTGNGTRTLSEESVSITIHNMGQQVADYLGSSPAPVPNAQTLYVLWGGANDIYAAVDTAVTNGQDPTAAATSAATTAVQNEIALIQELVSAGGTNFLVPNLPPLGGVPEYSSGAGATALDTGAAVFQAALAQGLGALKTAYAAQGLTVNFYQPDIFTLFATIAGNPMSVGLGNVTSSAQGISGDPDSYLIWDGLHPTTGGHHYVAAAAANLLNPLTGSVTQISGPAVILASQSATLTATVVPPPGGTGATVPTPTGSVTFFNGTSALGAAPLNGSATATLQVTGLAASTTPYTITAVYAGDTTYEPSASVTQAVSVLASAVSTTTTLNVALVSNGSGTGEAGDLTATVTPAVTTYGQPSGTVTFYDGTTSLGTASLSSGVATLTTQPLSAGNHSFTVSYAANGIFAASTSTAVAESVPPLGFTPAALPTTMTIKDGGTGTAQLSATGLGGFFGSLTLSCGTLPAHITCSFSSSTYAIPDPLTNIASAPVTLTISTTTAAALEMPLRPGSRTAPKTFAATLLFPGLGPLLLLGFRRRRGLASAVRLSIVIAVLSAAAVLGLSGCGDPDAAKGTYTVPVIFTPQASGVAAQTVNLSVTVD